MNEGLGSAATLAVKQRGGIQSIRKGEVPGRAAAKPRRTEQARSQRAKSRMAARRASQGVVLKKKHLSTEDALGRSAADSSRNRRPTISASSSGVGLRESDLSSRRIAGGATGASEARPMANEAEEENASTFER